MNLYDAISYCKTMINQNNSRILQLINEEEEVIESNGYSPTGTSIRNIRKFDVYKNPTYGEQQIWSILVADSNGSSLNSNIWGGTFSMAPTASSNEIGIVLMDKNGTCRAVMANGLDNTWTKVENPDIFWTNHWAKAIHDVFHGISRTKPDMTQDNFGSYKVGDEIEIPNKNCKGKILSFISYKNRYGMYEDPIVLIGDFNVKSMSHYVDFKDLSVLKTYVDKKQEKEDNETDRMMRFFASSQHDPNNPWYKNHERK